MIGYLPIMFFFYFFKKGLESQKRSNYNKDRKVKYSQSQKGGWCL